MVKKILVLMLAVVLLAACGRGNEAATAEQVMAVEEQVPAEAPAVDAPVEEEPEETGPPPYDPDLPNENNGLMATSGTCAACHRGVQDSTGADVSMDVDVKGAGGSIGFNPDYVLEALKVADLETVRLDMTDEETPAKFTLGESFTYVLMPISSA